MLLVSALGHLNPNPMLCVTFPKKLFSLRVLSPSLNPLAGGPPLVGSPRLLIQYIRSYPPDV